MFGVVGWWKTQTKVESTFLSSGLFAAEIAVPFGADPVEDRAGHVVSQTGALHGRDGAWVTRLTAVLPSFGFFM